MSLEINLSIDKECLVKGKPYLVHDRKATFGELENEINAVLEATTFPEIGDGSNAKNCSEWGIHFRCYSGVFNARDYRKVSSKEIPWSLLLVTVRPGNCEGIVIEMLGWNVETQAYEYVTGLKYLGFTSEQVYRVQAALNGAIFHHQGM